MHRLVWVIAFFVVGTLLFTGFQSVSSQQQASETTQERIQRDREMEAEVLSQLNRWRMRRGLNPLIRNSTLDDLAMIQAEYMAPLAPFTQERVDFHTDAFGEGVGRRAEIFGWQGYDAPERVLVSEIAAYYPGIEGAFNFWQNSRPHRTAATYNGFREAGVAVLRIQEWYLFYIVMGGRPRVLPVLFDPMNGNLYLTLDKSYFSDNYAPTRVRITDLQGQRLHEAEWLVWSERMQLPYGAPGDIIVTVTDGILDVSTRVNLYDARVFPSMPTPTPSPTATPSMTPTAVLETSTPIPPTPEPLPTKAPISGSYDLMFRYNVDAITLTNQSGRELDMRPLVLVSPWVSLELTGDWIGRYSQVPIDTFPPNYCMQMWSFEVYVGPPPLADGCVVRASGRSILSTGQRFWLAPSFDVYYARQFITRCTVENGECGFDLPR